MAVRNGKPRVAIGALPVTLKLGHMAPTGLARIHLNFVMYQPKPEETSRANAEEQAMLASAQNYQQG